MVVKSKMTELGCALGKGTINVNWCAWPISLGVLAGVGSSALESRFGMNHQHEDDDRAVGMEGTPERSTRGEACSGQDSEL